MPERTFTTGVVIGKFYPPHHGHTYLIDMARAHVAHLTVIVCDRAGQTIPGQLRAAWLRELHPDVEVMRVDDVYPPDDSRLWAELTIRWLGYAPDAVFTSEDYGDAYARFMGSIHVLVDRARATVPCSGADVRADPLACWEYLAPCVRAYFCKRVCVVRAESSGTTTLAAALAAHYNTVWVPEYGRAYYEAKMRRPDASAWRSEEFVHIAREQCRRENEAARRANRLLVCDTDAFATTIWHERYVGAPSQAVAAAAAGRCPDLYVLTDVDIPFVQDGTRDGEHLRRWMHERFIAELTGQGRPYIVVSGGHDARLHAAIRSVEARVVRRREAGSS
jgi:NadR type nicotinamide-nucleotide adenylyltransferase